MDTCRNAGPAARRASAPVVGEDRASSVDGQAGRGGSRAWKPWQKKFAGFPAKDNAAWMRAWRRGRTGYPIVDAGMRQHWRTGWMHNRVRMIAGSFLVKDLLVPWQRGEEWFWDTLVDADAVSNPANWQWVAGSGADAAPYFRVFNPMLQTERFDPERAYLRRWLPELRALPDAWIHRPWEAPKAVLAAAGVELGRDYPGPITDFRESRSAALDAYAAMKGPVATAASAQAPKPRHRR